tara:strand:+ start:2447 stop:2845 length:399 start_codon:yes stop_codon:yes gene_type:complete
MAYIGRQQTSSAFLKLDDISSQFNTSTTTFNLTLGGEAFFAGNPYSLLVSLGGVIQEPIASFTIVENQINFASAPRAGADFFIVVLATTNVDPLKTLTIGTRSTAHSMDLHGRSMVVRDRSGTNHPIAFNLA